MKVRLVATAWIAGATLPLLGAAAYFFACCVLPFHGTIHDLMPGCEAASRLMGSGPEDHHREAQPPSTAPEKQEPAKRMAADQTSKALILAVSHDRGPSASSAKADYRSFITLGALRCDQDVGLHVLVQTFLI
ncbi:MAG: hypothetical protein LC732_11285 [Acidobacteria bacterium]|nr:hypothetical protein [Acidobacteriota bacterium]